WAITIHKSQRLTLDNATICLGVKDFASGLSFVAISRVKALKGVAFRESFGGICHHNETTTRKMLKEDVIRQRNLDFVLDSYGVNLDEFEFDEE
ncbi:hypothetical protein EV359DRAFT_49726, partial [Lentinula novae-zelandiae]